MSNAMGSIGFQSDFKVGKRYLFEKRKQIKIVDPSSRDDQLAFITPNKDQLSSLKSLGFFEFSLSKSHLRQMRLNDGRTKSIHFGSIGFSSDLKTRFSINSKSSSTRSWEGFYGPSL